MKLIRKINLWVINSRLKTIGKTIAMVEEKLPAIKHLRMSLIAVLYIKPSDKIARGHLKKIEKIIGEWEIDLPKYKATIERLLIRKQELTKGGAKDEG